MQHRVAVLVFDGAAPFELGSVLEVFALARPELRTRWWYDVTVCSPDPSPLRSLGGLHLVAEAGLEALEGAATVIVPSWPDLDERVPEDVVAALRAAHAAGARLVAICSGAFVLAATRLLDGRRAATHWRYAEALRMRHPYIDVDERVLYVDHETVLTSAGSAAGLDLCLHIVRRDHGAAVANAVARRLVLAPHREGGQAQFIERPVAAPADDRVRQAVDWTLRHIDRPLTVSDLAARAFMSPRTFSRRFAEAMGESPGAWVNRQRVNATLPLLEQTDLGVDQVAMLAGFPSAAAMRKHFGRTLGVTPTQYRRSFAPFRGHGAPALRDTA